MQLMFYKILHKSQNKKPSPFLKTYLIKNLNLQSTRIMKTPFMLLFEAPVDWYSNNFSFDGSIYIVAGIIIVVIKGQIKEGYNYLTSLSCGGNWCNNCLIRCFSPAELT